MLPLIRLALARWPCPPDHEIVRRPVDASRHQEKMLTEAEARMAAVFAGFPPDPAWVESRGGRAR